MIITNNIMTVMIKIYYRHCCLSFCRTTVVVEPPSIVCQSMETIETSGAAAVLLPRVILWDPLTQFPMFFGNGMPCPTPGCSQNLCLLRWNTGSSAGHCPRFLHEMECISLLVSAVYRCVEGHEIVSTDPRILQYFQ